MTDRDALMSAIIANPEEDTPRLIFADWLQENGQDRRAQFIRRQIEADRAEPFSREACTAIDAANRLLAGYRGKWTKTVRQWVLEWNFARGFVEHVAVNVVNFPRDAARLFAAEPIRSLQLVRPTSEDPPLFLDEFLGTPQLASVTRLNLYRFRVAPVEIEDMIQCPHLRNLTDLCLRACPVPVEWLRKFLTGPSLPALVGLDLSDVTHLGPRLTDAMTLASNRRFRRLDLSGIAFTSDQIKRLLQSPCLSEVEELRVAWMTGGGREGALTLLDLGWVIPWNRLRLLDLNSQRVGDGGVEEIVKELNRRPGESPLRWLGLANTGITATGVRMLTRTPESKLKLFHLDLRGNGLQLAEQTALYGRFPDAKIET